MAQYMILYALSTLAFLFVFCYGYIIGCPNYVYLRHLYCLFNIDVITNAHQQRDTTPWVVGRLSSVVYLRGIMVLTIETRHPIGCN